MAMLTTYRKGSSYLHRIDPRTKLLLTAVIGILVYMADPIRLWLLAVVVLVLAGIGGIQVSNLLRGLRPVAVFFAAIFIAHLLAEGGSIVAAAIPVARFVLLLLFTTVLLHTTSLSELNTALTYFLRPLGRSGRDIAFMVGVAIALVPGLLLDKETITRAQAARGRTPKGLKGFVALIVPLLCRSFRKAEELADALESRCYHRDRECYYYGGAMTWNDYVLVGCSVAVLVLWVSV
jgi:energy-coupling factor transporter transmembrane protein EcfT